MADAFPQIVNGLVHQQKDSPMSRVWPGADTVPVHDHHSESSVVLVPMGDLLPNLRIWTGARHLLALTLKDD